MTSTVAAGSAGRRLDQWLAARFTYRDLDGWHAEIDDGNILVNDEAGAAARVLAAGDRVEYQPPARPEPPVATDYTVVHEDDGLLVINKPPDLPCHPGGRYFRHTLWALLREAYDDVRLINRIDRETSGLVLVGRNRRTAGKIGKQFERRQVEKEYLCVV